MNRPLLVLTSLIAFASPCRAASFVWFFSSANPTCDAVPANPVNLCNSDYNAPTATFADTTATFDITARGYDLGTGTSPLSLIVGTTVWTVPSMSPNNDLWAKFDGNNLGADETGLGVANPNTGGNREIEKTNFIQLDLTSLPAVQSVDLVISSLQSTETATVWGSNTLGQPGLLLATFVGPGAGGAAVVTFHYDLSAGLYLTVSANPNQSGPNNILIQSGFAAEIPTTTTTSSTTTTSTTTTTTTSTTTTTLASSRPLLVLRVLPTKFTPVPNVSLVDQFGSSVTTVDKPHYLCTPADKKGEDPSAPSHPDHLTAYVLRGKPVKKLNQTVSNQFGMIVLDAIKPSQLLVPTAKSLAAPAPPAPISPAVDHFQCYKVKRSKGSPKFNKITGVGIQDQFGSGTIDLLKVSDLCLPVDKNGEDPGAENHKFKLLCYRSRGNAPFATKQVWLDDQFGPLNGVNLSHRPRFCVPSSPSGAFLEEPRIYQTDLVHDAAVMRSPRGHHSGAPAFPDDPGFSAHQTSSRPLIQATDRPPSAAAQVATRDPLPPPSCPTLLLPPPRT